MKRILYISMCYPYDKARHAGGKTVAYYANRFAQEQDVDVQIICKIRDSEKKFLNNDDHIHVVTMPNGKLGRFFAYAISVNSKFNPYCKYGNTITKYIRNHLLDKAEKLKESGYIPDIVILEWTEMVLLINQVKSIFPKAFIVCSEHDVKFQSLERKYQAENSPLKKRIKNIKLKTVRKKEIEALKKCNLVVVQSTKDKDILTKVGIEKSKVLVISPFYMKSEGHWTDKDSNNIVIYGDMSREENYKSAIWFISNVFNQISDPQINLIVLGGNPPKELRQLSRDNIIITGFVENIFNYLNDSYCMVVPLQLGAGIKVKCLEALYYGIPLVTNDIGIEGIGATENRDYILCNKAEEFLNILQKLKNDKKMRLALSKNALKYATNHLDMEKSYQSYKEKINV